MGNRPRLLHYKEMFPHPLRAGTDVVTWNLLQAIAGELDVTVVSHDRGVPETSRRAVEEVVHRVELIRPWNLRGAAWRAGFAALNRTRAALTGTPVGVLYAETPPVGATLRRLTAQTPFDMCLIEYWNAASLARHLPPSTKKLLLIHDVQFKDYKRRAQQETDPGKRNRLERTAERVRRYEMRAFRAFDRLLTVSRNEEKTYRELLPGMDVRTLPTLVDAEALRAGDGPREASAIFLGHYRHHPNVDTARFLAEKIWPRVTTEVPGAVLMLAGRQPPPEVKALERIDGVRVPGEVDDLRGEYAKAGVFAAPMLTGTGIKIKILEAMAAGLPVVTTSRGAEALGAVHGTDILVEESPEKIAEAIVAMLRDPQKARAVGEAARRYILDHHTVGGVRDTILSLFRF